MCGVCGIYRWTGHSEKWTSQGGSDAQLQTIEAQMIRSLSDDGCLALVNVRLSRRQKTAGSIQEVR